MHVRCPGVERLDEEQVDEANDRRLVGEMQQIVKRNLVDVDDGARFTGQTGDHPFGGCRLRRVDAANGRSQIVLAEPLEHDARAKQQAQIIERQRLDVVEPRTGDERVALQPERQ